MIVVGIGVFSLFRSGTSGSVGNVTIWGTLDQKIMDQVLMTARQQDKSFLNVAYVQKNSDTYDSVLVSSMASGAAPDIFLLPQDEAVLFANKIIPIPYASLSQSTFVSSFIDEGQLFLTPTGSLALPFTIDPLVMYWNRDMFATAGIQQPPQYWNDLLTLAPKISSPATVGSSVKKSAVALGGWSNISYAKEILSALIMQAGDPILTRDAQGKLVASLGSNLQQAAENPTASALRFYTDFANPAKVTYSWNNSLPLSQDAFVAGDLAIYFGLASDYTTLASRNPNLHFSVAVLPQVQGNSSTMTFGRMTGLAIPRTAPNPSGAFTIVQKLTSQSEIAAMVQQTSLPPVRRDITVDTSGNAASAVFVQSALIAHAWDDVDPSATSDLFKSMVESVVSGASQPDAAVSESSLSLQALVRSAAIQ